MDALSVIADLYGHMEWADAAVWRAVLASQPARSDRAVYDRLQHFQHTQRAFLDVWHAVPFDAGSRKSPPIEELARSARAYHGKVAAYVGTIAPSALDTPVVVPWAAMVASRLGREIGNPTLGETLVQVAMHTTYHRGQVNARLRELGAEPPVTDFIAWIWFSRPVPEWPTETARPTIS